MTIKRDRQGQVILNDSDREQWVANHEGLYRWQQRSGQSEKVFVRNHRHDIDAVVTAELNKPPRSP